jgi:hypothetical protein
VLAFGLAALLASALAGCTGSPAGRADTSTPPRSSDANATEVASPPGDLYEPPHPLEAAAPGTLIWAEEVTGIDLHPPAKIWRILYHSLGANGGDIAVSGFAVVPAGPVPDGGRSVYAWAHGTVGLGDQCAPSHQIRENLPPYGGMQVEGGTVLVATDYEGLGTPGTPTNGDGAAEGRAVLDSARAVATLPNVGRIGDVVLAGHSQGGPAVLFATELASAYAPELQVVGAVALAPGAELATLADTLAESPYRGLVLIGAIGLRAAHPDLDLSAVLTADAVSDLARVEAECVDATVERYQPLSTAAMLMRPPSSDPAVLQLLEQNSPGAAGTLVPIFIGHGTADQQVPVELSERLLAKYCALDVNITRRTYESQDHDGVVDAASDDALAFVTARYNHEPALSDCS